MRQVYFLVISISLITPLAHAQRRDETWRELLPSGNGHGAVVASCTGCHSLKVIVNTRRSAAEWAVTVNDMIQRGAPVFPDEVEAMTSFLAKSFGANVPRLVNVNEARLEDLEKLPGMTPETAALIVEARAGAGALRNPEQLRRSLKMEKTEFEKIRYLFKYSE
jgi:DNA uptake protein ComE-like DNA-binding protein